MWQNQQPLAIRAEAAGDNVLEYVIQGDLVTTDIDAIDLAAVLTHAELHDHGTIRGVSGCERPRVDDLRHFALVEHLASKVQEQYAMNASLFVGPAMPSRSLHARRGHQQSTAV